MIKLNPLSKTEKRESEIKSRSIFLKQIQLP